MTAVNMPQTLKELGQYFDHTALKPDVTPDKIEVLCHEAAEISAAAVCVNPIYVPLASSLIEGTSVACCTVAGFPLGASSRAAKLFEAGQAIRDGAREIDMVMWIGGLKAGRIKDVEQDISSFVRICESAGAILKVILECALLTDDEKRAACKLCVNAGVNFVKTSTGFAASGAAVADVRLLAEIAGPTGVGVKAAGGIRTFDDTVAMISAGATRIGASATIDIMRQAAARGMK